MITKKAWPAQVPHRQGPRPSWKETNLEQTKNSPKTRKKNTESQSRYHSAGETTHRWCSGAAADGHALQVYLSPMTTETAAAPGGQHQNNMDNKIRPEHALT